MPDQVLKAMLRLMGLIMMRHSLLFLKPLLFVLLSLTVNLDWPLIWRMAPLCLMWTIWRESNARCFEDKEMTMAEISNRFLNLFFHWVGVLNIPQVSSRHQFVDLCSSFYL
jgi:hypothetical protein